MAAAVTEAADLLSDLGDDLLLRILFFLPAASDVARASALSSRWRHLWPLATALRFNVGSIPKAANYRIDDAAARRLNAAVTAVLARRGGGGHDIEDLEISLVDDYDDGPYCSSAQISEWLQFAASRVTGRFDLAVPSPATRKFRAIWHPNPTAKVTDNNDEEEILHAKMPSSARFVEMSLSLGSAILSIPVVTGAATAFSALTNVVLSFVRIAAGDSGRLGDFLSSSFCPRLRRLQMIYVDGLAALRIRAASTLEEIRLVHVYKMELLEVDAPGLRILDLERCFDIEAARISAPRLEVLAGEHIGRMEGLMFDGAVSVRRIERLEMCSHTSQLQLEHIDSELAVWLLRHCTGLNWLGVEVQLPSWSVKKHNVVENAYKDMIMDIPQLPNITRLTVTVDGRSHNIGATVAKLIGKCPRIEYLSIHINWSFIMEECLDPSCFCNLPENWEKQLISLEYLRTVEIYDLMPFGNRACLVRLLLLRSPGLEWMTVSLPQLVIKSIHKETGQEVKFEIPCYGGFWEPCAWECCEQGFRGVTEYKWTPGKKERAMD